MKRKLNEKVTVLFASSMLVMSVFFMIYAFPVSGELTEYNIIAEMISQINATEIYTSVYTLQSFATRRYGTWGNVEAATYIYNRLSSIPGLSVEYQSSYNNVIATLDGVDEASTTVYIAGAHYDSLSSDPSYAPGATDNGGGVAIVLEFARIMSQYRFNHTLKFALWNSEEDGVLGSTEYVKYVRDSGIDVSLYLNFDSACYDPNGGMMLEIISNYFSSWVADMMTEHNSLYGIGFMLNYNTHECLSDHMVFWNYGYTAVTTHAESHGPAHTPQDTIDSVSVEYAQKNGQLGMSVIATLAEIVENEIPEFTSAFVVLLTASAASATIILVSARKKTKAHKCELVI